MMDDLSEKGVRIDQIYFSAYHPEAISKAHLQKPHWRKPGIGMIEEAVRDFDLDLSQCWMIGDKETDIETGKNAGIRTILVTTGKGGKDSEKKASPDYVAKDLLDAASYIKKHQNKKNRTNE